MTGSTKAALGVFLLMCGIIAFQFETIAAAVAGVFSIIVGTLAMYSGVVDGDADL